MIVHPCGPDASKSGLGHNEPQQKSSNSIYILKDWDEAATTSPGAKKEPQVKRTQVILLWAHLGLGLVTYHFLKNYENQADVLITAKFGCML